jgi:ROK family
MKNAGARGAHVHIVAGIDIGGTKVRWALVRAERSSTRTVSAREVPTPKSRAGLKALLEQLFASLERKGVEYVGVSAAGHVDAARGTVISAHNTPSLGKLSVAGLAPEGITIAIENDARCFALAEARYGRARRVPSVLAVTLGTGIGRALIKNGMIEPVEHFEYAEPWERGYRKLAAGSAGRIAAYLAPHLASIAKRTGARAITLGGGRLRTPGLFSALKKELRRAGFLGPVSRSRYRQNSAVIGAALLVAPGGRKMVK